MKLRIAIMWFRILISEVWCGLATCLSPWLQHFFPIKKIVADFAYSLASLYLCSYLTVECFVKLLSFLPTELPVFSWQAENAGGSHEQAGSLNCSFVYELLSIFWFMCSFSTGFCQESYRVTRQVHGLCDWLLKQPHTIFHKVFVLLSSIFWVCYCTLFFDLTFWLCWYRLWRKLLRSFWTRVLLVAQVLNCWQHFVIIYSRKVVVNDLAMKQLRIRLRRYYSVNFYVYHLIYLLLLNVYLHFAGC